MIDPASGRDETADVAIEHGAIAEIGPKLAVPNGARVIEAEGMLVTPGLIDPHVHLREPGQEAKETIATGTAAAVAGGFTAVCCMPNTHPAIDSPEMVRAVLKRAEETASCRVFPVAAGTVGRSGETPTDVHLCRAAGAVAFSDDGDAIASAGVMAKVLEAVADAGSVFMQHCQEPTLTTGSVMHAGAVSARLGLIGWPRVAEELILERDLRLVAAGGGRARYHAQHLSSAGSVEIIKRARAVGLCVTAEVSPHHLLLIDELVAGESGHEFDTCAKMNPPLRERGDVEALRQAVAEGVITVLGTDHAPHAPDEKALPFEDAPFGIIGLETALAAYAEALVHTGAIEWPRLIALMTIEPARLCGLDAQGLGKLKVGGPADVTVIDPEREWTVTEADLAGKSRNTPLLGRHLRGRAAATVVGGEVRFQRVPKAEKSGQMAP